MKKRVLVLLGRYYPKASPNAICMQNIIDSMSERDYEFEIICYDDGLRTESPKNCHITKISRGVVQSLIYRFESKTDLPSRYILKVLSLLQKIKLIPFVICWPWTDPIVTYKELKAAKKICRRKPIDTVISVYMPLSSVIVGHNIKNIYPKVKFVAYFLDSLSGGYVPHFMNEQTYNRRSLQWEKRLLRNADKIIFMQSSKEFHQKTYSTYSNISAINYLDLPMLKRQEFVSPLSEEIILVYVGSIATSIRTPEQFLKVFSNIPYYNWTLIFVGESNCEILNEYAKKDKRIKVVGRCSHEESLEYVRQATALINLGNKNPNLTPSKVFEYIGFRKKIISTFWTETDTSMSYLNNYPSVFFIDEREKDTQTIAKRLIEFINFKNPTISYEELEKIFWANTPNAFIQTINDKHL